MSRLIREHRSIAEERRVVTSSWKRLGVVNGLRRTSTLSVYSRRFLQLHTACVRRSNEIFKRAPIEVWPKRKLLTYVSRHDTRRSLSSSILARAFAFDCDKAKPPTTATTATATAAAAAAAAATAGTTTTDAATATGTREREVCSKLEPPVALPSSNWQEMQLDVFLGPAPIRNCVRPTNEHAAYMLHRR
uniref:Uncharacterized protein n=1 Tax=Vespula pensylvanica TaxID=30213 RepID=A0A834P445_VESPE|nr:hypothetical protein H0235_007067 [Vespula pensylvanica]